MLVAGIICYLLIGFILCCLAVLEDHTEIYSEGKTTAQYTPYYWVKALANTVFAMVVWLPFIVWARIDPQNAPYAWMVS